MKAEYINQTNDDLSVVNTARVSFAKFSDAMSDKDERLIRYLAKNNHWTPFAHQRFTFECGDPIISGTITNPLLTAGMVHNAGMTKVRHSFYGWVNLIKSGHVYGDCIGDISGALLDAMPNSADAFGLKYDYQYNKVQLVMNETDPLFIDVTLRMGAPIPIRTQWFKSKEGAVENEESRRYISSTPQVFVPDEFRMAADSVKQGSGGVHPNSNNTIEFYIDIMSKAVDAYEAMIDAGICPEQARFILPQGCIVNWIWTANLTTYARVYSQRTDAHAQKEVRDLANMVGDIIKPLYPDILAELTGETT